MDGPAQGALSEELFHSFLQLAVKRQASDVHFEVGYPPTYRVFGELLAAKYPPLTHGDTETIANFVLQAPGSGFTPLDFREVDRSYSLPGVSRFRASVFKQRGSWGAVMRTIPFAIPDFSTLNLPAVVQTVAEARRGLVLITGATGTGKTKTLQLLAEQIAAAGCPVFTADMKGDLAGIGAAGRWPSEQPSSRASGPGWPPRSSCSRSREMTESRFVPASPASGRRSSPRCSR